MRKGICLALSLVFPTLIIGLVLAQSQFQSFSQRKPFDGFRVTYVGERRDGLSSRVAEKLEFNGAQVTSTQDIPELIEANDKAVILFDGAWVEARQNDLGLQVFLRQAASRGDRLVSIGGATSKFLEALDKAGIYEIPITEAGEARNPAYYNPPLAGFRMKTVGGYKGPSLLFSDSNNPDDLLQALVRW